MVSANDEFAGEQKYPDASLQELTPGRHGIRVSDGAGLHFIDLERVLDMSHDQDLPMTDIVNKLQFRFR